MARERFSLDEGWRFHLGDIVPPVLGPTQTYYAVKANKARGAAAPEFDDSGWRVVSVPHDWVVEGPCDPAADMDHGYKHTGIAWYRRSFPIAAADEGKRLLLEFDGVFRESTAWLNGHRLGHHSSGYTSFRYDITELANYGAANVLAVRVDASEFEGWWYEGGGIYRHVRLVKTDAVHFAPWGIGITSRISKNAVTVTVRAEIANEQDGPAAVQLAGRIVDGAGRTVGRIAAAATKIGAHGEKTVAAKAVVRNPKLWSLESPHLYRLEAALKSGRREVDAQEIPFGIRTIKFDGEKGFLLNGKHVRLNGTCNHQDFAGVGVAIPDRLNDYRIERLKAFGCNAWRCAHNPPAPELLDAADRLGMLMIDENRRFGTRAEVLEELTSMIRRDRNHPSIIAWSLLNEEIFMQNSDVGMRVAEKMVRLAHTLDPTRPTISAINSDWDHPFCRVFDIGGHNYKHPHYEEYHWAFPTHPIVATEIAASVSTRGIYANDPAAGHVSAYDVNAPVWAAPAQAAWSAVAEHPFVAGAFVWSGFDYRGEPTPYRWPCINSAFGMLDTCGFAKDNAWYYKAQWVDAPVLHILPHWNWAGREGREIDVWCHTNCDSVELFVNGRSEGRQDVAPSSHAAWKVKYEPGRLEARGYRGGKEVAAAKVETTGPAAAIALASSRPTLAADGQDVSAITAAVVDDQGRLVPTADHEIVFAADAGAAILGVGNGDPASHEPDKADRRRAFNGLCLAILQSSTAAGPITLTARSQGLRPASITLRAVKAPRMAALPVCPPAPAKP
jgi:beta-galactosidase